MELDERKLSILQRIIDDYILTAMPVGSRTISKHEDIGLSSATIRNVMSDLVDLGYLDQPHTSAGRVPSDKAYRLYVDRLMRTCGLSQSEMDTMQSRYTKMIDQVEDIIRETGEVLSDVTNYTSIVLAPQLSKVYLRRIQLVPVTKGRALVIIVTDTGILKDSFITLPEDIDVEKLNMLSNMLTNHFKNRSMEDISINIIDEIGTNLGSHRSFFNSVIDTLRRSLDSRDTRNVSLSGAKHMLSYPEYNDIDKAKSFLAVLETKDVLYDILSRASQLEFSITIGKENPTQELRDCSVVTATYRIGEKPIGSFGVIGPTRMDYSKVLAVLGYLGKSVSEVLTNFLDDDKER